MPLPSQYVNPCTNQGYGSLNPEQPVFRAKDWVVMLIIHQSLSASNFNILLQYLGPEGPSSGNYTILEHTIRLAMHRQMAIFIQGKIASWHKMYKFGVHTLNAMFRCTDAKCYNYLSKFIPSGTRVLSVKIQKLSLSLLHCVLLLWIPPTFRSSTEWSDWRTPNLLCILCQDVIFPCTKIATCLCIASNAVSIIFHKNTEAILYKNETFAVSPVKSNGLWPLAFKSPNYR